MDSEGFSDFGKAVIDYIVEYTEGIRDRDVLPSVEPGYLSELVPTEAPQKAESWQEVLQDIERVIMPGITHWVSPHFHAYYPAAISYPAIVGEMIASAIGSMGFSWIASPAVTELEVITMNWLGKMIGLPEEFLSCGEGPGGGVIQGSASESTLIGLLAAKERTVRRIKKLHPEMDENIIKTKLVAYTSDQSNSSVEKSGLLGSMPMRLLPTDENCSLRGSTLLEAIKNDEKNGLIPCYVVATLGTTGTCAFDNLSELGPICNDNHLWLHIDAAYAGAAFVCPEYRYLMTGVQYADSFNFNPHKWLLVNFDCSAMWVKDSRSLIDAFSVERIYLNHDKEGLAPDYRHWQIPLGRRFRSMKLWCIMRIYGIEGLQKHIRHSIQLARKFEEMVRKDERFEVVAEPAMGLVCFRIKGDNSLTKQLVERLMARKRIYVIVATFREKLIIRFVICSRFCQQEDVDYAWTEITSQTKEILKSVQYSTESTNSETMDKTAGTIATRLQQVLKIEETKIETQKIS